MSLKIAARTDLCLSKVAILFLREHSCSKRVTEQLRSLLELMRAVVSAFAKALLN